MIQITDSAKEYLTSMTESERKRFAYLSVLGGGCSGFQYKWDMIDDKDDGILIDDILVVDKIAEMFVLGCTVDYVKEFGGSYLKVVNPKNSKMSSTTFTTLQNHLIIERATTHKNISNHIQQFRKYRKILISLKE